MTTGDSAGGAGGGADAWLSSRAEEARESAERYRRLDSAAVAEWYSGQAAALEAVRVYLSNYAPDGQDAAPTKKGGTKPKGVDGQVLLAAQQMSDVQREQPEWLWYEHVDATRSFGRWKRDQRQAPYIRADLLLAASPPPPAGDAGGGSGMTVWLRQRRDECYALEVKYAAGTPYTDWHRAKGDAFAEAHIYAVAQQNDTLAAKDGAAGGGSSDLAALAEALKPYASADGTWFSLGLADLKKVAGRLVAPTPDLGALSAGAREQFQRLMALVDDIRANKGNSENAPRWAYTARDIAEEVRNLIHLAPTPDLGAQGEPVASDREELRKALTEITEAADALLVTLPGHWHDDATILLTDAANDARKVLSEATQNDLYDDRPAPAAPRSGGETQGGEGHHYGIVDPDYARVFTVARCIAWSEGYAVLMHGSFTRDLDLLAVPWAEEATDAEHLIRRITCALDDLDLLVKDPKSPSQATQKPHGRLAWTLTFKAFGDPRFIDISVMPRATPPSTVDTTRQDDRTGGETQGGGR